MRIIRVFPRRTRATPDDDLVRVGVGPGLFDEADEVHVSVAFTWDLLLAEKLEKAWRSVAPTKIGGPATGMRGEEFMPGMYLKPGFTITSRGCPNRCWFCSVWRREGSIRELQIKDGWNVLDDNLLACSKDHIRAVFAMLSRQPQRAVFSGGLEAARMEPWVANSLALLRPRSVYFAYDTKSDREPLAVAISMMREVRYGWGHSLSAYVLIGYPKDSFEAAQERLNFVLSLGALPFAMLYRDEAGRIEKSWRRFQREWCRPTIVGAKLRSVLEVHP